MAAKSNDEVKEVIAKAIADAAKNPRLRKGLFENHLKVLSQPPYDLTLEDFITAHDTHPNLRPAGGGPWGGDQTSGKGDRDLDEASGKGDRDLDEASGRWNAGQGGPRKGGRWNAGQGDSRNAGQTSGEGPPRRSGGQARGGGQRSTRG